jgi:hypothetical protein
MLVRWPHSASGKRCAAWVAGASHVTSLLELGCSWVLVGANTSRHIRLPFSGPLDGVLGQTRLVRARLMRFTLEAMPLWSASLWRIVAPSSTSPWPHQASPSDWGHTMWESPLPHHALMIATGPAPALTMIHWPFSCDPPAAVHPK